MSNFSVRDEQDDFTTKLSKMVDNGQLDQAIYMILALDNPRQQLITLQVLAHKGGTATLQLRFDLAIAVTVSRPPSYDIARDLLRAIDLAMETVTKRDMIRTRNIDLTRALVQAVEVARGLDETRLRNARVLARTLDTAHNVACEVDPDFGAELAILIRIIQVLISLYTDDWALMVLKHQLNEDYFQKLTDALDESMFLQYHNGSNSYKVISLVLQRLIASNLRHVTLEKVNNISPDTLANAVAPHLQALSDFLRIHSQITNSQFQPLTLVQMPKGSTKLELTGISDSLHALIDLFQLEKRRPDVDVRETAEADQTAPSAPRQETRKVKKSGEAIRFHLEKAHTYIETYAPELSFEERLPLVMELADVLKRLSATGIALRLGWHDEPRIR